MQIINCDDLQFTSEEKTIIIKTYQYFCILSTRGNPKDIFCISTHILLTVRSQNVSIKTITTLDFPTKSLPLVL